jgi:hypothetical protein
LSIGRRLAVTLAAIVVAGGCSAGQQAGPAGQQAGSVAQHAGPYDVDTAADKLIVTIHAYGGMEQSDYSWAPPEAQFSLYGDGRVILSCASADKSSPPLLPCLHETQISPNEIQMVVAAADKSGLLSDAKYDDYFVTDLDTTVFETTVGGTTHTVEAYALYPEFAGVGGAQAARQLLLAFRADIADLGRFLGRTVDTRPYAASALRIQSTQVEAPVSDLVRAWPLSMAPKDGNAGLTLTGADMATFVAAAAGANVFTVWQAPSGYYRLSAHPLFPGE